MMNREDDFYDPYNDREQNPSPTYFPGPNGAPAPLPGQTPSNTPNPPGPITYAPGTGPTIDLANPSYTPGGTVNGGFGPQPVPTPVAPKPEDAPVVAPRSSGGGAPAPVAAPPSAPGVSYPAITPPQATFSGGGATQSKSDDLYNFLMEKAHQSQQVDPNDPMIRSQSDNYSANLTRTGRQYLSELAERKGAGGNIGAESRMIAEKNAQAGASHEGDLIQHESDQRRAEIEHALSTGAQFMTAQQQMSLQKELATIDNNMKVYQAQIQDRQFGQNLDLGNRTLTQTGDLARAGMAQSAGQFGSSMSARTDEFNKNLAQRAYEFDTNDEFRRSPYAANG